MKKIVESMWSKNTMFLLPSMVLIKEDKNIFLIRCKPSIRDYFPIDLSQMSFTETSSLVAASTIEEYNSRDLELQQALEAQRRQRNVAYFQQALNYGLVSQPISTRSYE